MRPVGWAATISFRPTEIHCRRDGDVRQFRIWPGRKARPGEPGSPQYEAARLLGMFACREVCVGGEWREITAQSIADAIAAACPT